MVIDAEQGVTEQDERIAGYIHEAGKGCVFVINKWDLLEKDNATLGIYIAKIRDGFKYLAYAPIVCVSAKTGQRSGKIIATVDEVMAQFCRRVTTSELVHVFITPRPLVPRPPGKILLCHPGSNHAAGFCYFYQSARKHPLFL